MECTWFVVLFVGVLCSMLLGVNTNNIDELEDGNNGVQRMDTLSNIADNNAPQPSAATVILGCRYGHGLWTAPIETLNFTRLTSSAAAVHGTAYDPVEDKLYWTERNNDRIIRSDFDGSNHGTFFTDMSIPWGLELDVLNRKLYWMDQGSDTVKRVNLDGNGAITISSNAGTIGQVALDNGGRRIYWCEYDNHRIGNANLDGSDPRWISGLNSPLGLSIQEEEGRLYYTESPSGKVCSSDFFGGQHQILSSTGMNPTDLDIYNDDLYFVNEVASGNTNMLLKMAKDGSTSPSPVGSGFQQDCSYPYSIQIIRNGAASPLPPTETTTFAASTQQSTSTVSATTKQTIPGKEIKGLYLHCNGTSMVSYFNTSVLPYEVATDVHLRDSLCHATEYADNWASIYTDFHSCQTEMLESDSHMVYRNALILGSNESDSLILPLLKIIECRIERRHMSDTSFSANIDTHVSYGNYTFDLSIFHDETYRAPYTDEDYPVDVSVGDEIFLAATVVTVNDLDLFVDSCWGTPGPDAWDDASYSLIENGCAVDPFLKFYESGLSHTNRFSFPAFAFRGDSWLVFIHCQMLVCDVNTPDSRCSQGCVETKSSDNARMRRSASDLTTVSSGPLVIRG